MISPNPDQKRLLALDGGGLFGLISLGVLERMESQLREAHHAGPNFRLRDYFDYIGGTSVGAIIAAGLATGRSVAEMRALFLNHADEIFKPAGLWTRIRARFGYRLDSKGLTALLQQELSKKTLLQLMEDGTLARDKHLMIVVRNAATDSPWPISTNPNATYNQISHPQCNLHMPLWKLVRASTAAPTYFAPEEFTLEADDSKTTTLFEDGGVTPYNNPAWLLYRMATLPDYRCAWPDGERKMMVVSVGAGLKYRLLQKPSRLGESLLTSAKTIPAEFMRGFAVENDINCRVAGRCVYGAPIDRELGDLRPDASLENDLGRKFLYARYDADLSDHALKEVGLRELPDMADISAVNGLVKLGVAAADQVDIRAHFRSFLPI